MKKHIIIIVILIFLGIGLYPKRAVYQDGGTRTYSALFYKYIKWSRLVDCDDCIKPYYKENEFVLFPNNFKNLDAYWKDEYLKKIPKYEDNTKEIKITKEDKLNGESKIVGRVNIPKDAKHSISYSGKGEVIDYFVEYPAGEFEEDKSLSFDNKKANEVRKKVDRKNNLFYKNWKHDRGSNHSKKFGTINVDTIDSKDGYIQYIVKKGDKELYKSTKTMFIVEEPFKNLVSKGDDWWLLYNEVQRHSNPAMSSLKFHTRLIKNGEEIKYENVFGLSNLDGKLFYFFKKDKNSKIQYYLDGKIYDTNFDEIIHDRCCEPGAYNLVISLDGRMYFWGINGKQFTYNEMLLPGFKVNFEK
ncbi:hypothetical protein CSA08_04500 [Candidatus Gracilibacteria bacterium]|nr:MAG: hypothetical protein CSA08_04500 [Candidatus Gracilibacteria bacterium]